MEQEQEGYTLEDCKGKTERMFKFMGDKFWPQIHACQAIKQLECDVSSPEWPFEKALQLQTCIAKYRHIIGRIHPQIADFNDDGELVTTPEQFVEYMYHIWEILAGMLKFGLPDLQPLEHAKLQAAQPVDVATLQKYLAWVYTLPDFTIIKPKA